MLVVLVLVVVVVEKTKPPFTFFNTKFIKLPTPNLALSFADAMKKILDLECFSWRCHISYTHLSMRALKRFLRKIINDSLNH